VQPGTKIVIHLKPDSREFSDENAINRKYISDKNIHTFMLFYTFLIKCNLSIQALSTSTVILSAVLFL